MSYSAKVANPSRHNLASCMSLVACGLRMGLSSRDSPHSAVVLALVAVRRGPWGVGCTWENANTSSL